MSDETEKPDWLDERPEAVQALDPPDVRRRRAWLRNMVAEAQAALPVSARDSDRRQLEDDVFYDMVEDDDLLLQGAPALSVAHAFTRIVTELYASADDDARAMRKLGRRLNQLWFDLRRLDGLSKAFVPLGRADDILNEWLHPRSAGQRGWKEFRCWVQLLIYAYEDTPGRKATVSHRKPSEPHVGPLTAGQETIAIASTFGAFPEFVERYVALLERYIALLQQARLTWWPKKVRARVSLVDDVVYQRSVKRRRASRQEAAPAN